MGSCVVVLNEEESGKHVKLELQFPSTAVSSRFLQGKRFTGFELLKEIMQSEEFCRARIAKDPQLGEEVSSLLLFYAVKINAAGVDLIQHDKTYVVESCAEQSCPIG